MSVNVDESFDMRDLPVEPPEQALAKKLRSRFIVARQLEDPRGTHAPPTAPGSCDVFVSVGRRDGTPVIALPLPDHDGQRRYCVGKIRLGERAQKQP